MLSRNSISSGIILAICICIATLSSSTTDAFTTTTQLQSRATYTTGNTVLNQFGKKKQTEDFSDIETRDLTREEMLEINRRNTQVMNNELGAMTGISVLFSLPILYLCWIAFFSD